MLELIKGIEKVVLLTGLMLSSWTDIKNRQISVKLIFVVSELGLILFLIGKCMGDTMGGKELLAGMSVGGILLLVARLTGERIGYGDGMLFVVTGIFEGFWNNLYLLLLSSALAGGVALFFLISRKKGRADSMPFAPFVSVGYVLLTLKGL